MDTVIGTAGNDIIDLTWPGRATGSPEIVEGLEGNDALFGFGAGDVLDGGPGADTLRGGSGDDTYVVDAAGDVVIEAAGEGSDKVLASLTWVLGANLETLRLLGAADIGGTGNAANNVLFGNDGDNILDGGSGADTMAGGLGDDSYLVANAGDRVHERLGEGVDTVRSSVSFSLALGAFDLVHVENLTLIGAGDLNAVGNTLHNVLTGNSGNNVLEGGAGWDTLLGGEGFDFASHAGGLGVRADLGDPSANAGDAAGDVYDSIEGLIGSDFSDVLIGDEEDNRLLGREGDDLLDGKGGADRLAGGGGDDIYVVDHAGDVVMERAGLGIDTVRSSVHEALSAHVENLELVGSANLNGTGNALANRLVGNSGDNVLHGRGGTDTMEGGAGNDVYTVDDPSDRVIELFGEGIDTVRSTVSSILFAHVENLVLIDPSAGNSGSRIGPVNLNGSGNELANRLIGSRGDNVLNGRAGADTMAGGAGDDIYVVDEAGDRVLEANGAGTDEVRSVVSFSLQAQHIENLMLVGTGDLSGVGNGLANRLVGNAGNNVLNGGAGADTMAGRAGDDIYVVDEAGDRVLEANGAGTDEVRSVVSFSLAGQFVENLTLIGAANLNGTGNALANAITGNSGHNVLNGSTGNDTLTGGAGRDTFVFNTPLNAATNVDTIIDFSVPQDTIRLGNAVFTGLGAGVLSADAFHVGTAAADASDRIIYDVVTGALCFDADGNGAGAAVRFALLAPGLALTNADLFVV